MDLEDDTDLLGRSCPPSVLRRGRFRLAPSTVAVAPASCMPMCMCIRNPSGKRIAVCVQSISEVNDGSPPSLLASGASSALAVTPSISEVKAGASSTNTAMVTASVNLNGVKTGRVKVEYGNTSLLGNSTPWNAVSTPSGGAVLVSVPLTGLEPLNTYHYRLVAVSLNADKEKATSADATFETLLHWSKEGAQTSSAFTDQCHNAPEEGGQLEFRGFITSAAAVRLVCDQSESIKGRLGVEYGKEGKLTFSKACAVQVNGVPAPACAITGGIKVFLDSRLAQWAPTEISVTGNASCTVRGTYTFVNGGMGALSTAEAAIISPTLFGSAYPEYGVLATVPWEMNLTVSSPGRPGGWELSYPYGGENFGVN